MHYGQIQFHACCGLLKYISIISVKSMGGLLANWFPNYRNLVEFRAGRATMDGDMLHPDNQEGLLYVYKDDVSFVYFCWKNLTTNKVEDKITIFTKSFEFKRVNAQLNVRINCRLVSRY